MEGFQEDIESEPEPQPEPEHQVDPEVEDKPGAEPEPRLKYDDESKPENLLQSFIKSFVVAAGFTVLATMMLWYQWNKQNYKWFRLKHLIGTLFFNILKKMFVEDKHLPYILI